MMKPTYLPLVRGIEDADADTSDTQSGKLADAVNVHVHPERLNVLSMRPRFASKETIDANARLCVAGGRIAFVGEDDFGRLMNDGTYFEETSQALMFRNYGVLSTETFSSNSSRSIIAVAYAEQTNGDRIVLVSYDDGAGGFIVNYQTVALGRKSQEQLLTSLGTTALGRVFVFPRTGNNGYVSIVNSVSGAITLRVSTTNGGSFGSNITLVGTVLLDVCDNFDGTYSYLYTSGGGVLFRRVTEAGAVPEGPYTIDAKTNVTYAGIVRVSAGTWHCWVGGFPVDGNDTVYCYRVNSGTVALVGSIANAITPGTARVITVGGGSIKTGPSTNGVGSYCYLSGGGGDDPRVGRLFLSDNSTITYSTYTNPILPMGRIWCDTTFFGARIWGLQQKIGGCWEMVPTTETTTNFSVRCRPICYHTVTRGTFASLSSGLEVQRQFCVYNSTDRSKALLFGRDSSAVTLVDVGYNMPNRGTTVNNSNVDLMIGAVPRYWDGVGFVPAGIPQAPDIGATPSATGSLAAGTYIYTLVWEWSDAQGNRQQSPAELQTVVVPASGNVTIDVHPASIPYDERLLGARPGMRGVVYRSDAGGTTLKRGALYLEFTTFNPSSGLYGATQFVIQDNGTVSFATGEPLYMSPGGANELAATAVEETYLLRSYSDRFIGVSHSFPSQLWYTKTLQVGRAPEPNQALYFRLPEIATGLAVQDGNIYWFTERNCYAFVPQFADDTGQGGGGVDPVPLATGVGCEAANSIVETPVGVFFIGPRGPWVIPRGGGAPSFVGLEVEEFFRLFTTCRGAVYNPLFSEVVFAMETTAGTSHCLIIYNHVTQQWYRWIVGGDALLAPGTGVVGGVAQGLACADGVLALGASVAGIGEVMHLTDDGGTIDETISDDDREIHPYIETKNFYPSGGPGEQMRANRYVVDCSAATGQVLAMTSSTDDGANWYSPFTISTASLANPPIYRFPVQKTRGTRVRFYTTWNGEDAPAMQQRAPNRFNGVTLYSSPLGRAKAGAAYYRG